MNENEKNCDTGAESQGMKLTRCDGCTLNSNIVPVDNGQLEYLSV